MLGKKLINSGPISSGANTFASENFNTVLYTGNGSSQRIGGYINRGAVFNGSNSYISTPTPISDTTNVDFSVSLWFKPNTTISSGSYQHILGQLSDGARGPVMIILTGTGTGTATIDLWRNYNGTLNLSTGYSATFTSGVWVNIAISYTASNSTYITYFNGSSLGSKTVSYAASQATSSNLIFGTYNSSYWLNGSLDQVRFFNKAISSSEVTTLYGETFASTTKSTTDIFDDNSVCKALYQLDGNANDTGGASGKFGSAAHI